MRWLGVLCVLFLFACQPASKDEIVVGTIAGPETELVKVAKKEAFKSDNLRVRIVEFSDYNLPNEALRDKSLDANVYQHQRYLDAAIASRGYPFEVIGKTFIYPMGVYSKKISSMQDLPESAMIALPNDPSNEARALLLLESNGIIKLKKAAFPSVADITENDKHLRFKTMDAAQLPRVLPDVTAAVINTNFALPAGLLPERDAILLEDKSSPYANLVVIRNDSPKKAKLLLFVKALHSDAVKQKAQALFQGGAIPAW